MKQPEALRLADWLDKLDVRTPDKIQNCVSAAAELRRLHEANQAMMEALKTALQAFNEVNHARTSPDWFTNGRSAAIQHEILWHQRGVDTIHAAIAEGEQA